ncbi:MAG: hypothetical protein IJE43_12275 [Alphaproteobacteria bacterium]|nr:hypothetical protein [Alphaproteobacteria bacterium]
MKNIYDRSDFKSIIDEFSVKEISDEKLICLISELVASGVTIKTAQPVYNFASTGGPSSLTTILVPLYLYSYGVNVINIGVPGRPAGAIDVLSQINGYNVNLDVNSLSMKDHFYYHLAANNLYAPMDNELFMFRKEIGKINIPNLAIASLIAKNMVTNAFAMGLDVRVSPFSNFGSTWDECVENAKKFCRISNKLNIKSYCFLSEANRPYQRYIGRGEALIALHNIFYSKDMSCAEEHNNYCKRIAIKILQKTGARINQANSLLESFSKNLLLQGSSLCEFDRTVQDLKKQPRKELFANKNGYIHYNMYNIRKLIVEKQKKLYDNKPFPDNYGVTLLCNDGDYVVKGKPIASIRSINSDFETKDDSYYLISDEIVNNERKEMLING